MCDSCICICDIKTDAANLKKTYRQKKTIFNIFLVDPAEATSHSIFCR